MDLPTPPFLEARATRRWRVAAAGPLAGGDPLADADGAEAAGPVPVEDDPLPTGVPSHTEPRT